MKKLISSTNFILVQSKFLEKGEINQDEFILRTTNYAKFLKKPLELEMFILCLEAEHFNYKKHSSLEFEEAKKRDTILFKGFQFIELNEDGMIGYVKDNMVDLVYPFPNVRNHTIEDLVQQGALLTSRALKEIGIENK